mmetsp:Transcript_108431/g.258811  ORF Transcript_108431/g.258811 Transcript_108431/m.258811 type:complete len:204 (-) Transcript_108431:374-985(-)
MTSSANHVVPTAGITWAKMPGTENACPARRAAANVRRRASAPSARTACSLTRMLPVRQPVPTASSNCPARAASAEFASTARKTVPSAAGGTSAKNASPRGTSRTTTGAPRNVPAVTTRRAQVKLAGSACSARRPATFAKAQRTVLSARTPPTSRHCINAKASVPWASSTRASETWGGPVRRASETAISASPPPSVWNAKTAPS